MFSHDGWLILRPPVDQSVEMTRLGTVLPNLVDHLPLIEIPAVWEDPNYTDTQPPSPKDVTDASHHLRHTGLPVRLPGGLPGGLPVRLLVGLPDNFSGSLSDKFSGSLPGSKSLRETDTAQEEASIDSADDQLDEYWTPGGLPILVSPGALRRWVKTASPVDIVHVLKATNLGLNNSTDRTLAYGAGEAACAKQGRPLDDPTAISTWRDIAQEWRTAEAQYPGAVAARWTHAINGNLMGSSSKTLTTEPMYPERSWNSPVFDARHHQLREWLFMIPEITPAVVLAVWRQTVHKIYANLPSTDLHTPGER